MSRKAGGFIRGVSRCAEYVVFTTKAIASSTLRLGAYDPRKTVGAVWFDYNQDGRLDLFCANQDGTLNGLFRNDGNRFVDVAHEMGMDGRRGDGSGRRRPGHTAELGRLR